MKIGTTIEATIKKIIDIGIMASATRICRDVGQCHKYIREAEDIYKKKNSLTSTASLFSYSLITLLSVRDMVALSLKNGVMNSVEVIKNKVVSFLFWFIDKS